MLLLHQLHVSYIVMNLVNTVILFWLLRFNSIVINRILNDGFDNLMSICLPNANISIEYISPCLDFVNDISHVVNLHKPV